MAVSGKGGEVGVFQRRLQRPRVWPWCRIGHDARMHTVVPVGRAADQMALSKRGKFPTRDHDLPDLATDAREKRFGSTMDNELSLSN